MSSSECVISAVSAYGPMRIELYDQHLNRLARGFGQLRQVVRPGIYSLQYGSGNEFREELLRVKAGESVDRRIELLIPTTAPISTSKTSHEFHRYAARALSLDLDPSRAGEGAGLMVFARSLDDTGREPVSLRGLTLVDSSLNELCQLGESKFHHGAEGWAGAAIRVSPGGYALRWAAAPTRRDPVVLQSLWASAGWTTIVFLGAPGSDRRLPPEDRHRVVRQAASVHMAPVAAGFESGPDRVQLDNDPTGPSSTGARVDQALELALLGLRTGSTVIPDDLLDLLMHAKFRNPMLGIVGAHVLLQRRVKDWPLFDTVIRNLGRLVGSDHPDVRALAVMGQSKGNPLQTAPVEPVTWPPMLSEGLRAAIDSEWGRDGGQSIVTPMADIAAASHLPEFPWTCWSENPYPTVTRVEQSALVAADRAPDAVIGLTLPDGIQLDGASATAGLTRLPSPGRLILRRNLSPPFLATYPRPSRESLAGTDAEVAARQITVARMAEHFRALQEFDSGLTLIDLKPAHFKPLGLPRGMVEEMMPLMRMFTRITPGLEPTLPSKESSMTNKDLEVEQVAMARLARNEAQVKESLRNFAIGNPLGAEKDTARLVRRLMTKNRLNQEEASAVARGIRATEALATPALARAELVPAGAEAIWGQTVDFVGVSFLERGVRAARAVARIAFSGGRAQGTGFLVAPGLLLTNNHVISSPDEARGMVAEFDYELDLQDNLRAMARFALDPDSFFVTHPVRDLDFTLLAVGRRLTGTKELTEFGWCGLSAANDKHAIGEAVNIVQHPRGRYKEVVLRENRLVARADEALHYVADTEPGASGSPVYNNQWQVIALHHWGGPFRAVFSDQGARVPTEVNEGIRISAIVGALSKMVPTLAGTQAERLRTTLTSWELTDPEATSEQPLAAGAAPMAPSAGTRVNADGSVTLTLPVEITIGLGMRQSPVLPAPTLPVATNTLPASPRTPTVSEATKPDEDYGDRIGYEPGFIPGHVVPLPKLKPVIASQAVRVLGAAGSDRIELRYHHFSSVINKKRRLPFFVACNIDGKTSKYINRDTGEVRALNPNNTDHGLMERVDLAGAEASERWYDDPRLPPDAVAGQDTYSEQVVAGFPTGMGRILRMFQRGHLVRRLDPAWGTKSQALLAEADTFHFTNCAPQVGFFNMGRAKPSTTGTGGGKLWRAVENLVLRNARNTRSRVTCFTGPIFDETDRPYRTILIPQSFFKIAVWSEDDKLCSLAMIADQSKVLQVWPEALFSSRGESVAPLGAEAFQEPDELERVEDFLTTIADIERKTNLNFGQAVRGADIRAGQESLRPKDISEVSSFLELRR